MSQPLHCGKQFLKMSIARARLMTDEYSAHRWLKKGWTGTHETVCHRTFEMPALTFMSILPKVENRFGSAKRHDMPHRLLQSPVGDFLAAEFPSL
jgi:hypothetical protein